MQDITKVNLLRPDQVREFSEEKERIDKTLNDPFTARTLTDPSGARNLSKRIGKMLEDQAPRPLTGQEKDRLIKREVELRTQWTNNMPTDETMRKNPPGAVDHHRRWEQHNKPAIKEWKNIRRQLEPQSEDPDLANIERFRPGGMAGAFRSDAQITGQMQYGNVPQENWDQVFETEPNSALKQVVEGKKRREFTPEQKDAARERLAKARAMRKNLKPVVQEEKELVD